MYLDYFLFVSIVVNIFLKMYSLEGGFLQGLHSFFSSFNSNSRHIASTYI
jgi:hypothetical protein